MPRTGVDQGAVGTDHTAVLEFAQVLDEFRK